MKVGKIPYLNSVLFYHGLENDAVELVPLVPSRLSSAAVEDTVDAGPVPLVTCWDIEARYGPLAVGGRGDFCIATTRAARSILLFSKRPFEELEGAGVGVTEETSTSVRLMKTLFHHCWRVRPERYGHLDWPRNDAFLLIGDEALIHRRGVKDYPYVADLGEVWRDWTGFPFVFARWVARRDIARERRLELIERLERSLESGWRDLDAIVTPRAGELNMTVAEMREYLEGFRFEMTTEEREAIARFRQLDRATTLDKAAATPTDP